MDFYFIFWGVSWKEEYDLAKDSTRLISKYKVYLFFNNFPPCLKEQKKSTLLIVFYVKPNHFKKQRFSSSLLLT